MKQKGFTLLEILVIVGIGAVLLTVALGSIYQIIYSTKSSGGQNQALTDVNRAALQIKKDIQSTQDTDLSEGIPQSSVIFSWTDFNATDNNTHSGNYTLSGTRLLRGYDGESQIIGRYITSISFTQYGRVIEVEITATSNTTPPISKTLEFSTYMRSEGF